MRIRPLFDLFKQGSLKIDDLYTQSVRMFSYKLYKNVLPQEIAEIFPKITHCYNTRSARNNLFVERANPRSMKFVVPRCWNSLSPAIKQAPSLASFKTQSKNSLLAPYEGFICKLSHCPSCSSNASQAGLSNPPTHLLPSSIIHPFTPLTPLSVHCFLSFCSMFVSVFRWHC